VGVTVFNNERGEKPLETMLNDAARAEKTTHLAEMDVSLPYASFWRRLGAGTVDLIVLAFFVTAFGKVAALSKDTAYVLLPVLWATTASYTVVMHARYGATWGKMLCDGLLGNHSGTAGWGQVNTILDPETVAVRAHQPSHSCQTVKLFPYRLGFGPVKNQYDRIKSARPLNLPGNIDDNLVDAGSV
jgi:hypothetical protein